MSANERQVGGTHYKNGGEEHWDRVNRLGLDYFQGQITKYVERWKLKNGVQDLEKARHFLDKYIELQRKEPAPEQPDQNAMFQEQRSREGAEHFTEEGYHGSGLNHYKCRHCKRDIEALGFMDAARLHRSDCPAWPHAARGTTPGS